MQLTQLQLQTLTLYFGSPCERLYIERERQVFKSKLCHNRLNTIDFCLLHFKRSALPGPPFVSSKLQARSLRVVVAGQRAPHHDVFGEVLHATGFLVFTQDGGVTPSPGR